MLIILFMLRGITHSEELASVRVLSSFMTFQRFYCSKAELRRSNKVQIDVLMLDGVRKDFWSVLSA